MTLERLKADARVEISIAKMMNAQAASATEATDAEARDFYTKNPDRFKRPETVRASHILLLIDPKADEAAKKAGHGEDRRGPQTSEERRGLRRAREAELAGWERPARRRPGLLPEREDGAGVRRCRLPPEGRRDRATS